MASDMGALIVIASTLIFVGLVTYFAAIYKLSDVRRKREKPMPQFVPTTLIEVKERPAFYIDVDN